MKTTKHVITLKVQGETVDYIAHSFTNSDGEIEIDFVTFASGIASYNVSTILLNDDLMRSAMFQLEDHYLADELLRE